MPYLRSFRNPFPRHRGVILDHPRQCRLLDACALGIQQPLLHSLQFPALTPQPNRLEQEALSAVLFEETVEKESKTP